jgi:hypothetical protein
MRVPLTKAVVLLLAACLSSQSALASYHLDDTYVETLSTPTIFPTTAVDQDSAGLKVGDEVCVTNYIMDTGVIMVNGSSGSGQQHQTFIH